MKKRPFFKVLVWDSLQVGHTPELHFMNSLQWMEAVILIQRWWHVQEVFLSLKFAFQRFLKPPNLFTNIHHIFISCGFVTGLYINIPLHGQMKISSLLILNKSSVYSITYCISDKHIFETKNRAGSLYLSRLKPRSMKEKSSNKRNQLRYY